jgi:hypothetical protein
VVEGEQRLTEELGEMGEEIFLRFLKRLKSAKSQQPCGVAGFFVFVYGKFSRK